MGDSVVVPPGFRAQVDPLLTILLGAAGAVAAGAPGQGAVAAGRAGVAG